VSIVRFAVFSHPSLVELIAAVLFRISPQTQSPSHTRPSTPPPAPPGHPKSVPSPRTQPSTSGPAPEKPQVVDMELDLPPSPPPVEDILAARRAKRLAILAKYSATDDSPSQSQSPSSAVQPPLPSSSLSDPVTLAPSPSATAGVVVADAGTPVLETTVNRVTMNANGLAGQ
jgi:serine/threonine-protein kinase PRP4